ncbi:hypothetical protein BD780_000248 [Clostridium tetanomorphum]|uniref:hypothetical protein n=1 Tax=Clostridium tetanomorphum TaxID=1553 RepID=UPI00044B024A|nr:hypothetical protein [Clostridium tetanomorphum]KAJ51126.1 hypothetical protein CTM_14608 [Clostridium tetanomorphum DSM 665]NRS83023.1 hypothetical protein [Clostridium tetanomorphum]SQC01061.1 Uncharacterised protein [Clostridium tetanomorphum]
MSKKHKHKHKSKYRLENMQEDVFGENYLIMLAILLILFSNEGNYSNNMDYKEDSNNIKHNPENKNEKQCLDESPQLNVIEILKDESIHIEEYKEDDINILEDDEIEEDDITVLEDIKLQECINILEDDKIEEGNINILEDDKIEEENINILEDDEIEEENINILEDDKIEEGNINILEDDEVEEENIDILEDDKIGEGNINILEDDKIGEENINALEDNEVKEEDVNVLEDNEAKEEDINVLQHTKVREEDANILENNKIKEQNVNVLQEVVCKTTEDKESNINYIEDLNTNIESFNIHDLCKNNLNKNIKNIENKLTPNPKIIINPKVTLLNVCTVQCNSSDNKLMNTSFEQVVSKVPVVLGKTEIQIFIESLNKLPEPVFQINELNEKVFIDECELVLGTEKLFIKGFIQENMEYATVKSVKTTEVKGNIKKTTINIPFKCCKKFSFNILPKLSNEKIFYKMDSMKVLETNNKEEIKIIENTLLNLYTFENVRKKTIVTLEITLLQNQQIFIPNF